MFSARFLLREARAIKGDYMDKFGNNNYERVKNRERFAERFTTDESSGISKLTSYGCMQRHKITKAEMFESDERNAEMNRELRNREDRAEDRLQILVLKFLQAGYKLKADETLEEYVERIQEDMNNGIL